ncbi:MAG TPA: hypothetical protein VK969_03800 [Acidimicrobiia bacterium]|nr:hypothetical protein [Acidimicrobiia bacterium]
MPVKDPNLEKRRRGLDDLMRTVRLLINYEFALRHVMKGGTFDDALPDDLRGSIERLIGGFVVDRRSFELNPAEDLAMLYEELAAAAVRADPASDLEPEVVNQVLDEGPEAFLQRIAGYADVYGRHRRTDPPWLRSGTFGDADPKKLGAELRRAQTWLESTVIGYFRLAVAAGMAAERARSGEVDLEELSFLVRFGSFVALEAVRPAAVTGGNLKNTRKGFPQPEENRKIVADWYQRYVKYDVDGAPDPVTAAYRESDEKAISWNGYYRALDRHRKSLTGWQRVAVYANVMWSKPEQADGDSAGRDVPPAATPDGHD